MKKKWLFLDSFWLKIFAIATMTIDHIGIIIFDSLYEPIYQDLYFLFREIGRLSLPLFAFMIVEGVIHTKNVKNYLLRLGISAGVIAIGLVIANSIMGGQIVAMPYIGNIFIDFLLGAAIIACLRLKDYKKFWTLVPLGLYVVALKLDYSIFYMVCLQYEWYSLGIILVFFIGHYLTEFLVKMQASQYHIDYEGYKLTHNYQFIRNFVGVILFISYSLGIYFLLNAYPYLSSMENETQLLAIFASVFLIFYNGKRGYNKKWFQYGCYAYYAVHIVLLFGISLLL